MSLVNAHDLETLKAMSDAELAELERSLEEQLAMREDRLVFSEEREELFFNIGFGAFAFLCMVFLYQLYRLWFIHLGSGETNLYFVWLMVFIGGAAIAAWVRTKSEPALRRAVLYLVRHREILIYAVIFLLSVVSR